MSPLLLSLLLLSLLLMDPPKWYGPTFGFPLNLLPLYLHSKGILVYHIYYAKTAKLAI